MEVLLRTIRQPSRTYFIQTSDIFYFHTSILARVFGKILSMFRFYEILNFSKYLRSDFNSFKV